MTNRFTRRSINIDDDNFARCKRLAIDMAVSISGVIRLLIREACEKHVMVSPICWFVSSSVLQVVLRSVQWLHPTLTELFKLVRSQFRDKGMRSARWVPDLDKYSWTIMGEEMTNRFTRRSINIDDDNFVRCKRLAIDLPVSIFGVIRLLTREAYEKHVMVSLICWFVSSWALQVVLSGVHPVWPDR